MSEWRTISLGEVCKKITDGSHYSPKECSNGIPMFSVKDMTDSGFNRTQYKTISEIDFADLTRQGCKPELDDILIAKDGSVLKHVFRVKNETDYVVLSSIAILRPNQNFVYPQFLVYAIKNPSVIETILTNYVSGSGVPRIILKDFKKVEIQIPSLSEQQAIAEVLSSLDDKIELLHRNNKTLEEMAYTIFHNWFVESVEMEADIVTLGSLCERITKGTTPTTLGRQFAEIGINFVKVESLSESGGFIPSKFAHIDIETDNLLYRSKLKLGDVLFTIAGTIGRTALVPEHILPANTNQAVAIMRADTNKISSLFLKYVMRSNFIKEIMNTKIVHAVQPNLSLGEIAKTEILMPNHEKLLKFDQITGAIQAKIDSNHLHIEKIENLRDMILPRLMSGALRVKEFTHELSVL